MSRCTSKVFIKAVDNVVVPVEQAGAHVLVGVDCHDVAVVFE